MKPLYDKNLQSATHPKIGDYWHDMYCPVTVVVSVTEEHVFICEKTKDVDDQHWTWDLDKITSYTRADFLQRHRYGRIGNPEFIATDSADIKNEFWADVIPEAHVWVK